MNEIDNNLQFMYEYYYKYVINDNIKYYKINKKIE
jgi:hypothetical protein